MKNGNSLKKVQTDFFSAKKKPHKDRTTSVLISQPAHSKPKKIGNYLKTESEVS